MRKREMGMKTSKIVTIALAASIVAIVAGAIALGVVLSKV